MFIPSWLGWVIFWAVILYICYRLMPIDDWDFTSPIIVMGIFLLAAVFTLTWFIRGCIG